MSFVTPPAPADVKFEGDPARISLRCTDSEAVLGWTARSHSGSIDFGSELVGFRTGASTILLHTYKAVPAGCCSRARRALKDVLIDFDDRGAHLEWCRALQEWRERSGRPKRLLVLVNPYGGKRQAAKIYKDKVEKLFNAAGIKVTYKETKFFRHASEEAAGLDLESQNGIVCVSGDGVLVEVLNGLLNRRDWRIAVKMPLGIIPAGTSNGMAKSILDLGGEECTAENAAFAIIKGGTRSVDVATVGQGAVRYHCSVLLVWGITSDVDVESERFRFLGETRTTVQLADGCLDMMIVRGGVTSWKLLSLFLKMESGGHVNSDIVQYIKVRAVRLEPGGRVNGSVGGGIVSADGEVLARGMGAVGNGSNDCMRYDEGMDISVAQGLATVFGPL